MVSTVLTTAAVIVLMTQLVTNRLDTATWDVNPVTHMRYALTVSNCFI